MPFRAAFYRTLAVGVANSQFQRSDNATVIPVEASCLVPDDGIIARFRDVMPFAEAP